MFRRKCYDRLLEWKTSLSWNERHAHRGCSSCGKTTLVREFAKNEYADFLYIDFSMVGNDTLELFRSQRKT